MSKTIQQILGGRNLSGLVQNVKPGLPQNAVPAAFNGGGLRRTVDGNSAVYISVDGTRQTARLAHYGSPSQKRSLKGVSERPIKLLHSFEQVQINATTLINLESPNGERQRMGEQEVTRQVEETRTLMDNTRVASLFSALALGAIYYDGDGNLLPSSSGAAVTVDFNVPAGHKDQLDFDGGGDIIGASWATAGTKILTDIQQIHEAALFESGYPLAHAVYGKNILDYLLTNTQTKELINRNQQTQQEALRATIPNGFAGLTWWPGYNWFFEDEDGDNQRLVGDDTIVFFPEPDPTWFEWIEGTFPVPTNVTFDGGAQGFASSFNPTAGRFAYGKVSHDPPSGVMYYGDTWIPAIKVPKAVFIADVTP